MENLITDSEWWSLAVSVVALLASMGAVYMSIQSNKELLAKQHQFETELRRQSVLEKHKLVITKNVAEINGILNDAVITPARSDIKDMTAEKVNDIVGNIAKRYAEVRNTYKTIEHHFDNQSRAEIDQKLNEIEGYNETFMSQPSNPKLRTDIGDIVIKIGSISNLILERLDENITDSSFQ